MSIEKTLEDRGNKYGKFDEHARITQNIKAAMASSPNWPNLPPDMLEALEMIAHKIGRILNGDPNYHDSWHDIIGYTKLVADRLEKPVPEVACDPFVGVWIPFHATYSSVCPVSEDLIVSIKTAQSVAHGRVIPPERAGNFVWNTRIYQDAIITGFCVEKQP
jgi:hypothetical protein